MRGDITVCIGTVGYPTFKRCHLLVKKIAKKDNRIKKVVVIENKYPHSEYLNEMRKVGTETTWCLQVDEDMYLNDIAIDSLIDLARIKHNRDSVKILNASGLLFDLFLRTNVGSLKLWSSKALRDLEFRNVVGSDRDFARRAKKLGYRNVETKLVLGKHDSAPSKEIAYFKYYDRNVKSINFNNHKKKAKSFTRFLKKKFLRDRSLISLYAYAGAEFALTGYNLPVGAEESNNIYRDYRDQVLTKELECKINKLRKEIIK